jgi:hypothetical protein
LGRLVLPAAWANEVEEGGSAAASCFVSLRLDVFGAQKWSTTRPIRTIHQFAVIQRDVMREDQDLVELRLVGLCTPISPATAPATFFGAATAGKSICGT